MSPKKLMACATRIAVLILLVSGAAWSQSSAPKASDFVIHNVRIFDGTNVIQNGSVWVQGGLIKAVGSKVNAPAGVRVIDGTGQTLLPGLIDAHVHSWGEAPKEALVLGVTT